MGVKVLPLSIHYCLAAISVLYRFIMSKAQGAAWDVLSLLGGVISKNTTGFLVPN